MTDVTTYHSDKTPGLRRFVASVTELCGSLDGEPVTEDSKTAYLFDAEATLVGRFGHLVHGSCVVFQPDADMAIFQCPISTDRPTALAAWKTIETLVPMLDRPPKVAFDTSTTYFAVLAAALRLGDLPPDAEHLEAYCTWPDILPLGTGASCNLRFTTANGGDAKSTPDLAFFRRLTAIHDTYAPMAITTIVNWKGAPQIANATLRLRLPQSVSAHDKAAAIRCLTHAATASESPAVRRHITRLLDRHA